MNTRTHILFTHTNTQDGKGQAEKGEKKEEKKEGESATAAGKAGGSSVPAQNTPAAPTNAAGAQSTDAGGSGGNEWKCEYVCVIEWRVCFKLLIYFAFLAL